ncbi:2-oxo acid dehydrogenase subunit E2 [Spiroplasma endosymbiont of Labia minor]|uniref:2-oxo acid dehydrogenase subunit E2 n=1 Tax=Spiroplasma endosymbiont of Labia minor TaxID=3066305 RepID=UPI0030CF60B9
MVHLRARNLSSKGRLKKWLFNGNNIHFGDDFALVEMDFGEVVIKANADGIISRTIKLGSPVKNGTILASIYTDDKKEFRPKKIKNNNIKDEEIVHNFDESNLTSAEDERDNYSGAVVYDRNMMARTPYSQTASDIMTEPNYNKIMGALGEGVQDSKPLDRFAQMRANIANSISNSPNAPKPQSKEDIEKLSNMSIQDAVNNNNDAAALLNTSNLEGASKFRQMVAARKAKLLEENNFKENDNSEKVVSAMDNLDENGRPLILRNIIQNRLEKFNNSGGDPNAVKSDLVATSVRNKDNQNNAKKVTDDDENSQWRAYPAQQKDEVQMTNAYLDKQNADSVRSSSIWGDYLNNDEEEMVIDANNNSIGGFSRMPSVAPSTLLNKISEKEDLNYTDKKIADLYDQQRREKLFKTRNQRDAIRNRMNEFMGKPSVETNFSSAIVNQAIANNNSKINFDSTNSDILSKPKVETEINGVQIPEYFLQTLPFQDANTGAVNFLMYKDTPNGTVEFSKWLQQIQNNQTTSVNSNEMNNQQNSNLHLMDYPINEKNKQTINNDNSFNNFNSINTNNNQNGDFQMSSDNVEYLKKEIENLKELLKQNNKLDYANASLGNPNLSNSNPDDFFTKMMQYMMMQYMMQSFSSGGVDNQNMKLIINNYLDNFARKNNLLSPLENNADMQTVNFSNPANDNTINRNNSLPPTSAYLDIHSNTKDEQREQINVTRMPAVKSMILSQSYIPPLTISTEVDMTALLKLKHILKKNSQDGIIYSTIAFIIKGISISLIEYPKLNSQYDPENNEQIIKNYHNIGLATETSEGIIVPVMKFVEKLNLKQVAIDVKEITGRLRRGELFNYETSGSTITLANYGNVGAIQATPTIFYPNAAVIGIGKIVKKPVVVDNEKLAIKAMMNVSLTVDQRILDAAEAGRFLSRLKEVLENPELISI